MGEEIGRRACVFGLVPLHCAFENQSPKTQVRRPKTPPFTPHHAALYTWLYHPYLIPFEQVYLILNSSRVKFSLIIVLLLAGFALSSAALAQQPGQKTLTTIQEAPPAKEQESEYS